MLSATEIATFRRRLHARAEKLGREVNEVRDERTQASLEARETVGDAGDAGAHRALDELRNAEEARDAHELQAIGRALERIKQGGYGVCIDCGAEIPRSRLKAQSAALRCILCQEHSDRISPMMI
jgi:DnaK suppressor protein